MEENIKLNGKNAQLESQLKETLNKLHHHEEFKENYVQLQKQLQKMKETPNQIEASLQVHNSTQPMAKSDRESSNFVWTPGSSSGFSSP